ncbi:transcription factor IIIA-like [Micropterus salmoides]|uniref:transcription factor IIIA-like n=1 Tax=Micropterus salmoides TaxID=27706 RepID=UPI0018ED595E|nr:transcription factor IIIA-like [Micropterus salmoides]XP_045902797.1 transcription factor IIIA-like [Micropterus dolomieu]
MKTKTEPQKRYICSFPDCPAAYNKQWKLDVHLCKHTGIKPYSCEHDGCGKSFCSPYHLSRHELTHSGVKPFHCTEDGCTEAFTTNANRNRHISRVHTQDQKKYVCKFEGCTLEFKKNKQLKSHMCEQHTQLPPYPCTYEGCQMRFTFPSKLKRHEKVHKGYPCAEDGCSFIGKTWTDYLKHRKEQHRLIVKCDQCNKVFRDSWFLQQHQQVHSEMRVVLRCPREGCDRSFTTTFNLESHISSFHEELRPFACTHAGCRKTFAMRQSLQRHSIVHDPDRKKLKKPGPKRSLASRLSGYSETKRVVRKKRREPESIRESAQKTDPPGPVELVSLLQDTSLLCSPGVDTHGLTNALTTPLTMKA